MKRCPCDYYVDDVIVLNDDSTSDFDQYIEISGYLNDCENDFDGFVKDWEEMVSSHQIEFYMRGCEYKNNP